MNILSIQSHVAYGHVGNAAAVFPLQRLGIEVWPVHTVQFAAHLGYGPPQGRVFDAQAITDVVRGIEARGAFARCDGVISGFIGSPDIGEAVLDAVARVKKANPGARYCCDPVIGDHGAAYVSPAVAAFFRARAVAMADLVTPNRFELEFLTGRSCATQEEALAAMRELQARGPSVVLATSMQTEVTPAGHLDVLVRDADACARVRTPRLDTAVHGTGDLIAALFFAHWLRTGDAAQAAAMAASSVYGVLEKTVAAGNEEIALIAAQEEFARPRRMFAAEAIVP